MATTSAELIRDLNHSLGLELQETIGEETLEAILAEQVDRMIQRDFQALVQLLYRIDINETRLRKLLEDNSGENAGWIIARLILERQRQKIETRRQYRQKDTADDPDPERL